MSRLNAQLATKAAKALERAELWRKTEQAVASLSANDKARADRIGRLTNDEYAFPEHTLRQTRVMHHPAGSRQAAFWLLAAKRAKHHMLAEEFVANGLNPVFDYLGAESWRAVTFDQSGELMELGRFSAGHLATFPELREALANGGAL